MKIIAFLLITFPLFTNAQQIKEITKDKFEGSTKITTTTEVLQKMLGVKQLEVWGGVYISKDTTIKFKHLSFAFVTSIVTTIDKDNFVILLNEKGDALKLKKLSDSYKVYGKGDYVVFTVDVDQENLQWIKENPITDIRLESSRFNFDFKLKDKYQMIIPNIANLLLEQVK